MLPCLKIVRHILEVQCNMKKLLALLLVGGAIIMGVIIPNMIANGVDVPIGAISIVGVVIIGLPLLVAFIGGNNNGE